MRILNNEKMIILWLDEVKGFEGKKTALFSFLNQRSYKRYLKVNTYVHLSNYSFNLLNFLIYTKI